MSARDGGPAFPETRYGGHYSRHPVDQLPGMTLRDWFAAQTLVAMGNWMPYAGSLQSIQYDSDEFHKRMVQARAKHAYLQADAMIAERSK